MTLLALDARVEIQRAGGPRELPLGDLFRDYYETALAPGELVTAVTVPLLPPASGASFVKFLPRTADDYATVAVAAVVALEPDGERCREARIALGSVGVTPLARPGRGGAAPGQRLGERVSAPPARRPGGGGSAERSPRVGGVQARDGGGHGRARAQPGVGGGGALGAGSRSAAVTFTQECVIPVERTRLWDLLMDVPPVGPLRARRESSRRSTAAPIAAGSRSRSGPSASRSRAPSPSRSRTGTPGGRACAPRPTTGGWAAGSAHA